MLSPNLFPLILCGRRLGSCCTSPQKKHIRHISRSVLCCQLCLWKQRERGGKNREKEKKREKRKTYWQSLLSELGRTAKRQLKLHKHWMIFKYIFLFTDFLIFVQIFRAKAKCQNSEYQSKNNFLYTHKHHQLWLTLFPLLWSLLATVELL